MQRATFLEVALLYYRGGYSMPKEKIFADVAVLGGGAAGLMAAASAARSLKKAGQTVAVVEKLPRVGKKLLATGNGRCNLGNIDLSAKWYFGSGKAQLSSLLDKYNNKYMQDIWEQLGLFTYCDGSGRIYPYSNHAASVLDVLRLQLQLLQVHELCNTPVKAISKTKDGKFILHGSDREISCASLVVTAGGLASPKLGGCGSGYALLEALGHTVTPLFPSLAPVFVQEPFIAALKGLRARCRIKLICDGVHTAQEDGEVQFTEKAVSGICVFQLSRRINEFFRLHTVDGKPCKQVALSFDFFPDYTQSELFLHLQRHADGASFPVPTLFTGLLHSRIATVLCKAGGIKPLTKAAGNLSKKELGALALLLKDFRVTPCAPSSFETAQVTAGGVPADEIDFRTLSSKRCAGLYLAGEIVDIDGMCGGYNLHWAWVSGILAGQSAAREICNKGKKRPYDTDYKYKTSPYLS